MARDALADVYSVYRCDDWINVAAPPLSSEVLHSFADHFPDGGLVANPPDGGVFAAAEEGWRNARVQITLLP